MRNIFVHKYFEKLQFLTQQLFAVFKTFQIFAHSKISNFINFALQTAKIFKIFIFNKFSNKTNNLFKLAKITASTLLATVIIGTIILTVGGVKGHLTLHRSYLCSVCCVLTDPVCVVFTVLLTVGMACARRLCLRTVIPLLLSQSQTVCFFLFLIFFLLLSKMQSKM